MRKRMTRKTRLAVLLGVAGLVVALDQLSKRTIVAMGEAGELPRTLIPGVMDLTLVYNTGAAFSFGADGTKTLLFAAFSVAVVIGIAVYLYKEDNLPAPAVVALAAVAGGGIGNLIDRVAAGRVVDFLATTFINFPVFNVADIAVTCGAAVLIIAMFFGDHD